jgi:hypothetical protein
VPSQAPLTAGVCPGRVKLVSIKMCVCDDRKDWKVPSQRLWLGQMGRAPRGRFALTKPWEQLSHVSLAIGLWEASCLTGVLNPLLWLGLGGCWPHHSFSAPISRCAVKIPRPQHPPASVQTMCATLSRGVSVNRFSWEGTSR